MIITKLIFNRSAKHINEENFTGYSDSSNTSNTSNSLNCFIILSKVIAKFDHDLIKKIYVMMFFRMPSRLRLAYSSLMATVW